MANEKLSQLGIETSINSTDYLIKVKAAAGGDVLVTFANLLAAIPAGSIDFAMLLSTIFSGQVQSQANTGSAGGTIYWVNLGGIKIMYVTTTALINTSTGPQWTINLPTFFTTNPAGVCSWTTINTTAQQDMNLIITSTTTATLVGWSSGTTTAQYATAFMIGT